MEYSDKDLETLVRSSLACLERAEVPSELRQVAFGKVFDLLVGGRTTPTARGNGPGPTPPDAEGTSREGEPLDGVATRLGVQRDVVDRVYFIEGDRLELVVSPSRLDVAKSRATEQIALLVAAGRQGSGLDQDGWTSVEPIREVCENFKRYDQGNFATTIKDLGSILTVRGTGRDRKLRMTAPAWQKARDLIANLAGA